MVDINMNNECANFNRVHKVEKVIQRSNFVYDFIGTS